MVQSLFSGLAMVAFLMAFTGGTAHAEPSGQHGSGVGHTNNGAYTASVNTGRSSASQRSMTLGTGGTKPTANTAANIHALTVYLQWKKCLDNMLPKCP